MVWIGPIAGSSGFTGGSDVSAHTAVGHETPIALALQRRLMLETEPGQPNRSRAGFPGLTRSEDGLGSIRPAYFVRSVRGGAMVEAGRRSRSLAALSVAPLLLVLAVAVWFVSDRLVVIGPFDRATIAWAVVVPLLALAPGAAALAGSGSTSPGLARLLVAVASIVTGIFVVLGLASAITFIDCRPATGPLEVVPRTLPTAFV